MRDPEYNPYEDEMWGKRAARLRERPIVFDEPWVQVYMDKLALKWPANMAKAAADRATGRK